jgi:hypothetical protein
MTPLGFLLPMWLAAASTAATELRIEVEAQPLAATTLKPAPSTATHELGVEVRTETRYRILPDGRIEVYCGQSARPTLQGAVRERRLVKSGEEAR